MNTFVQDCDDKNPLIRSLALRTMACLRVESVIEYLVPLLDKALDDVDPYVRKTAAVCVAKLYDMDPERCEEEGFILRLRKMINDSSPFVVSNAIFALHDISQTIGRDCIHVNSKMLNRLLLCLEECSEWGQIIILDVLAGYVPQDEAEAITVVEKTIPRLQHANVAVVMGCVRVQSLTNRAIKVILLNIVIYIFTFLWSLLLIIPGIIAGYRYRFALYNLCENPEMGVMDALNMSKAQTRGHKWELFVLDLSFIGWNLLCALTLGILTIWIAPYVQQTDIGYFEAIKQASGIGGRPNGGGDGQYHPDDRFGGGPSAYDPER